MEQHLQVAIHIASVALVHKAEVILAFLLLLPQRKDQEHVGVNGA